jgi:hypothetical protein
MAVVRGVELQLEVLPAPLQGDADEVVARMSARVATGHDATSCGDARAAWGHGLAWVSLARVHAQRIAPTLGP